VCDFVFVRTIKVKPKRLKKQSPNLASLVHHDSSLTNEYQVKRSKLGQGHRVENAKGDRVAGVSYALYRVPLI